MLDSGEFYNNYYGHTVSHLEVVLDNLTKSPSRTSDNGQPRIIYLIGDSTLDNKAWFFDQAEAVNGYERILKPPFSRKDVAYCLNKELVTRGLGDRFVVVNCAVEESTIGGRRQELLPQDKFVRDHVKPDDIVIISLGGNDIALRPTCCTALNMMSLLCCSTTSCIQRYSFGSTVSSGDCFFWDAITGLGPSCWSNCFSFPPGLGYFLHLFKDRTADVVRRVVGGPHGPPRSIAVCMVYYLDEKPGGSWAEHALQLLGYNRNPRHLQSVMKRVFQLATSQINLPGSTVTAIPLFEALDGSDTTDYAERVEPSALGGEKMARLILDYILPQERFKQ